MRLLVTRPEPDAAETAARLRAMGHDVLVQPMLAIAFAPPPAALPVPAAIVATSRNGIRALRAWPAAEGWRALPLFVTGEGTARAAAEAGFADVRPGGADAAALARRLVGDIPSRRGPILHVAGRDRTVALAEGLGAAGYDLRTVEAYRAESVATLRPDVAAALAAGGVDGVLLFSRRTSEAFVAAVAKAGLLAALQRIVAFAISAPAAAPLRSRIGDVRIAAHPDFDGIAGMIGRAAPPELA